MVVPFIVPAPGHLKAITINNNAIKTKSVNVDLILSALNATEMKLSNDPLFADAPVWEPYVTAKQWDLESLRDGEKSVYVKFKSALNEISDTFSASIVLDTSPPIIGAVPILINGGLLKTDVRQVVLTLNASGASFVEIYNEIDLDTITGGIILPYQTTINWTLSEGNGIKTVYVVFADDIGNRSSFFSSDITLIGQTASVPAIVLPHDGDVTTAPFIEVQGTGDPGADMQINITKESV